MPAEWLRLNRGRLFGRGNLSWAARHRRLAHPALAVFRHGVWRGRHNAQAAKLSGTEHSIGLFGTSCRIAVDFDRGNGVANALANRLGDTTEDFGIGDIVVRHSAEIAVLDRYSGRSGDFVLALRLLSCSGLEADGLDQCVKVIDDAVIEAVELRPLLVRGSGVGTDGAEEASGKRGVDSFEQLQEDQAD
jgi:hypothetical protein